MAHPQSSARGYWAKQRLDIAGAQITADSSNNLLLNAGLALSGEETDIITQDSTAVKMAGGLALSGQGSANAITQNSTAVLVPDGLALSGQAHANAITQDSTAVIIPDGIVLGGLASSNAVTQNSTAVILPGQLQVNAARYIAGNSTGYLFTTEAGLPATDGGNYKWTFVVNSTGVAGIAVNTTGTTWKYCRMTSDINTT